ncbi:glycosidase [Verrucomicrobia bacterium S94]|nr:glycosidase [Verrucomicrobia bacterium S94]
MKRHPENPLITAADVPPSNPAYRVRGAFNPAATEYNGEIILLLRVAEDVPPQEGRIAVPYVTFTDGKGRPDVLDVALDDPDVQLKDTRGVVYQGQDYLSTLSHIRLARSSDGIRFSVDPEPFLFPADETEKFGVEDARITRLGETWWINYTAVSEDGWYTKLASTRDFKTVERHGCIFHPQNKDVSIFPEKINGKYCALHRPNNSGFGRPSIWYAESPDLIHWGNHRCLIRPRDTEYERLKIGGGAPCIRTSKGWLQIYHGKGDGERYSLFGLLLDADHPDRVIARGEKPLLQPEMPYENEGFFPGVVFTNGIVERNGMLYIYYGAADGITALATADKEELAAALLHSR